MFKLFVLKLKKELEETKALHRIALKEKEAEIDLLKKNAEQEIEMKTREVTSLLKLDAQQKIAKIELDHKKKFEDLRQSSHEETLKLKEQLLLDFQNKFTNAVSKLHEEGNVTTKFVQDLALNMVGNMAPKLPQPVTKMETKIITEKNDK